MTRCLTSRQRRCTSQCRTVVLYAVMRVGWAAATVRRSIKLRYLTAVIMSFLGGPCICVFNRGKPGQWCHGHSLSFTFFTRGGGGTLCRCSLSVGCEQVSFVPRGKILNTMSTLSARNTKARFHYPSWHPVHAWRRPSYSTSALEDLFVIIDVIIPFYLHFQSCFIGSVMYILWL